MKDRVDDTGAVVPEFNGILKRLKMGEGEVRIDIKKASAVRKGSIFRTASGPNTPEYRPSHCRNELRTLVRKAEWMDQAAIREYLEQSDPEDWKEILGKLLLTPHFRKEDQFARNSASHCDLVSFLNDVFFSLVEEDLDEHLAHTVAWLNNLETLHVGALDLSSFRANNAAMVRACRRSDHNTVFMLYQAGFRIRTNLCTDLHVIDNGDEDLALEITRLEALARPVYLLAEYNFGDTADPVDRAFELIDCCHTIVDTRMALISKIEVISEYLKKFVGKMLDLCEDTAEIELFLDYDDEVEDVSLKGTMMLPRIHEAFKLHLREFVAHDYCQQVVRKAFYSNCNFRKRSNGVLGMLGCFLLQALMTPLATLFHSLSRIFHLKDGNFLSDLFRPFNLDVPVRRLASHYAMDILFVVLVIITLSNPSDEPGVLDLDAYDYLSHVMVIGHIFCDLEKMTQMSWSVRTAGKTRFQAILARGVGFFGGHYINYMTCRFFGHLLFLIGSLVKNIGFSTDLSMGHFACKTLKDNPTLKVVIQLAVGTVTSPNGTEETFSSTTPPPPCDDLSNFTGFHPVRVGSAVQGIALVIAMIQLLQILRLHHSFSAIVIGLTKCFDTVVSFFIAYLSITLAFSVGIFFVLDKFECLNQEPNDSEVRELFGRYGSFSGTLLTLILNVFDPGYPEAIAKCTNGSSHLVGLAMWYVYFLIVVVVLINMLIALMNSVMARIQINSVSEWKYSQTLLWMRFCSKGVVLPSPLNLIDFIVRLFMCLIHRSTKVFWESWISDPKEDKKMKGRYKILMSALSNRYINDLEAFEDTVNRDILVRDQLDRMERAMLKICGGNMEVRKRQPNEVTPSDDIRGH